MTDRRIPPLNASPPVRSIRSVSIDSRSSSRSSSGSRGPTGLLHDDSSFLSDVAMGVVKDDRAKMQRRVAQALSFITAMMCCLCAGSMVAFSLYGPLFISHLHYTQYEVNAISVTLELTSYLFVPVVGFLTDRFSPRPIVFVSAIFFGFGYFLAAWVYYRGPRETGGLPMGLMQLAFVPIGMGTGAMYLSALTATVKNFGRGNNKGLALALPSAAFGLSAVWQSQIGSIYLREPAVDGVEGDVDVFRYFIFLGATLAGTGLVASLFMRIVDEEELIDQGVDELERSGYLDRSGMLENSALLRRPHTQDVSVNGTYGTSSERVHSTIDDDGIEDWDDDDGMSDDSHDSQFEKIKKMLLLNAETMRFLTDPTMWLLAMAFFLTTGPVETYINNIGTIIGTTYPPPMKVAPANNAANHVSILAIASTLARLIGGAISDWLAPPEQDARHDDELVDAKPRRFYISRVALLLFFNALLFLGFVLLATPLSQAKPETLLPISALVGIGNGANFALEPVVISVVWGVQNFGTNFGIVAMTPAIGALLWSGIYSAVYDHAAGADGLCYGWSCYGSLAIAWAACILAGCFFWIYAWKGKNGWSKRGIVV